MTSMPEPEQRIESGADGIEIELLERLEAALLTLPRFSCEVFLANRLDGLSYAEIAILTKTSVKRIKREMALALFGLARAMDGKPLRWWE